MPLDTLSVDTDWKRENNAAGAAAVAALAGAPRRPYSWNGWEWDPTLFPDPRRFIDWAHAHGLSLTLNIHPTIDSNDPRYPGVAARAGPLTPDQGTCKLLQADPTGSCMTFDWNRAPARRVLLAARWVQFGTFQPLGRLHSNHGDRLPWEYGAAADRSATRFLRLREALGPYIYTLARRSSETGLPITGGPYLQCPGARPPIGIPRNLRSAGTWSWHRSPPTATPLQPPLVTAGPVDRLLHRPALSRSGDGDAVGTALTDAGARARRGDRAHPAGRAVHRAGAPNPKLTLAVYPGPRGSFTLYDDQGVGFGYQHGSYAMTRLTESRRGQRETVTIGAAEGHLAAALHARDWELQLRDVARPRRVVLTRGHRATALGSKPGSRGWSYGAATRTLTIHTGRVSTSRPVTVTADATATRPRGRSSSP